ncbi:hypothetical protein HYX16_00880 [Candidatus Woesearchaeota archaeon]|nr:hypothetical protein [Candidatus Woesearchaeota archaeon]
MADLKTIKDIDRATWNEFKSLAAKDNLKLGVFFKVLLKEYGKSKSSFWKNILEFDRIITDKEAEEIEKSIIKVRKEYGFRK